MSDATDTQDSHPAHADDGKVDAIGTVVVIAGLVAMFIFAIWSGGLD